MVRDFLVLSVLAAVAVGDEVKDYDSLTAEKLCDYPIDILFLQDTTGSFMDDMPYTRAQLPKLIELINEMFPGSRTGIAEFRDKPYYPLGETDDFCYKKNDYGALTTNPAKTEWAFSILQPSGGGDLPEDHYQALVNSVLDLSVGWRPIVNSNDKLSVEIRALIEEGKYLAPAETARKAAAVNDETEEPMGVLAEVAEFFEGPLRMTPGDAAIEAGDEVAARVIAVITDAGPHYNGQMKLYAPNPAHPTWNVPQNLPANTGQILNGDLNAACKEQDYLDPKVFKKVVKDDNNFQILSLFTDNVTKTWEWINDDLLDQPHDFRQTIDALSSNLLPQILKAIQSVASYVCRDLTTTTTTTTTTVATTTTTTTVATTAAPTTEAPTPAPTTAAPTTQAPTPAPTTAAPTVAPTTTIAPNTEVPTIPFTTTSPPPSTAVPTIPSTTTTTEEVAPTQPPAGTSSAPHPEECATTTCQEVGVMIRLKEKPRHMILEVFNDAESTEAAA